MGNNKVQWEPHLNPTRFWIIGAGHFGRLAAERIIDRIPDAAVTVVDQRPFTIQGSGIVKQVCDGIQWLDTMLTRDVTVDMIVPAIPVHVAAEWLKCKLKILYDINSFEIPDDWLGCMPHPIRGKTGQAYVSHADFICPDNCPEPEKICTHTGRSRPTDLFRLLGGLDVEDVLPIVLRSYQLLPGVGGLQPADLIGALDLACRSNSQRRLMVATACRCHGVVDFIRLNKKRGSAG